MITTINRCTHETGASFRAPIWEGLVDGKLVVFHRRRWVVETVLSLIASGDILPEGDTVVRMCQWAAQHSPSLHARIVATRVDGFQE